MRWPELRSRNTVLWLAVGRYCSGADGNRSYTDFVIWKTRPTRRWHLGAVTSNHVEWFVSGSRQRARSCTVLAQYRALTNVSKVWWKSHSTHETVLRTIEDGLLPVLSQATSLSGRCFVGRFPERYRCSMNSSWTQCHPLPVDVKTSWSKVITSRSTLRKSEIESDTDELLSLKTQCWPFRGSIPVVLNRGSTPPQGSVSKFSWECEPLNALQQACATFSAAGQFRILENYRGSHQFLLDETLFIPLKN